MAMTEAQLVERISAALEAEGYTRANGLDFRRTPSLAVDKAFSLTYVGDPPMGYIGLAEEAKGRLEIQIARLVNDDQAAAQVTLHEDGRTVLDAVFAAAADDGEFVIEDDGRATDIDQPTGSSFVVLRMRVPVNFEAVLAG